MRSTSRRAILNVVTTRTQARIGASGSATRTPPPRDRPVVLGGGRACCQAERTQLALIHSTIDLAVQSRSDRDYPRCTRLLLRLYTSFGADATQSRRALWIMGHDAPPLRSTSMSPELPRTMVDRTGARSLITSSPGVYEKDGRHVTNSRRLDISAHLSPSAPQRTRQRPRRARQARNATTSPCIARNTLSLIRFLAKTGANLSLCPPDRA